MNIYERYECVIDSAMHPERRFQAKQELRQLNVHKIPRDKGIALLELIDERLNVNKSGDYADIYSHVYETVSLGMQSDTGSVWDPIKIRLTNTESQAIHDALSWLLRSACACGCTLNIEKHSPKYVTEDVLDLMKLFPFETSKSLFSYI